MDKSAIRMELIRAGFQGSDLILRHGTKTLGLIRGGKAPRLYLTGGKSFLLNYGTGRLELTETNGYPVGEFLLGKSLRYLGSTYKAIPDPFCPDWVNLEAQQGRIARFQSDHIELFIPAIEPALLLFVGWAIQERRGQLLGTNWIAE